MRDRPHWSASFIFQRRGRRRYLRRDAVATYGGTPSLLQPIFILFLQRADIRLQLFHDIARDDGAIRM